MTDVLPFMPYIEGPKMDWTVNDGLYHWFLKWKLKCENILDCELASLSESRQCKKLISCDDSFVLYQMRAKINMSTTQWRVPKKTHLIANLPYRLKQYQTHHKYLRVQLDTCADVNIMPKSVYQMMFNDPKVQQLAPNDITLGVYTDHQVDILGKCNFFMIHPDTKKAHAVAFLCCKQ